MNDTLAGLTAASVDRSRTERALGRGGVATVFGNGLSFAHA